MLKLTLLLIGHCLGDFVFQSKGMANGKHHSKKTLAWHCLIYGITLSLCLSGFGTVWQWLISCAAVALTHTLIDWGRVALENRLLKGRPLWLYMADQALHLIILILFAHLWPTQNAFGSVIAEPMRRHLPSINMETALLILLAYVACLNPAGVFIRKVFAHLHQRGAQHPAALPLTDGSAEYANHEPTANQRMAEDPIGGFVIGMLERICVLTLTLLAQYAAISFVLAAKSLARFQQLNDKDFAEKYLVGTLLSVVIALLLGILVNLVRGKQL